MSFIRKLSDGPVVRQTESTSLVLRVCMLLALGSHAAESSGSETCSDPQEAVTQGVLLQKHFKRVEMETITFNTVATLEDIDDDALCMWKLAEDCAKPTIYKGIAYDVCIEKDYPTPWCSHDPVHRGSWSVCKWKCSNQSAILRPTEKVATEGWFNRNIDYLKRVGSSASVGYGNQLKRNGRVADETAKCTAPLVRFAAMNDINAVRPIEEGRDPFFPAEASSIAPAGASCGDSAHDIFEECDKYNHWETMDSISRSRGVPFAVFNPSTNIPSHTDVQQGELGTCYFLAAVASIAYTSPKIIDQMFVRRKHWKQGVISTKWLINGMESIVEVDKTVPSRGGRPYFTSISREGGAWWPAILEKAWSKIYGSYKAAEAGLWSVAAAAITRAPTVTYIHSQVKADHLWEMLVTASKNNWPMGGITDQSHYGLAAGHAYSVLKVWQHQSRGKLVRVRNPWHTNFYKGSQPNPSFGDDSGIFTMSFEEFLVAFYTSSIAKVVPSYRVTSQRVTEVEGLISGAFAFNIKSSKWFAASIVWPNHRMLCKVPQPIHVLAVRSHDNGRVFAPDQTAHVGNAAYVEISSEAGAKGNAGTYTVALSAAFPIDTFIHEVYLNIYADEAVDLLTPRVDYATLVAGMVGPAIRGEACDIVTAKNRGLWRRNKAQQIRGVSTYESWDGGSFAYYVDHADMWFLVGNGKRQAVSKGRLWSFAKLSRDDFTCGCQDSENAISGLSDVECDMVRPPNVKYANVRCDTSVQYTKLAEAYCPVTCELDACNAPLPSGLDVSPVVVRDKSDCDDTQGFVDERGHFCRDWKAYDCSQAAEEWQYTQIGEDAILENCRFTCLLC